MRKLILLLIPVLLVVQGNTQFLSVSGKKTINSSSGQEVVLQAMNFGNWMVMEGYMMKSAAQATSQHLWKQKLNTLIGAANTDAFYTAWLKKYVTEADIQLIKSWGFNAVRLPLHYEYFVNAGSPDVWNDLGFTVTDSVLAWCSRNQVYAVLDLHACPGGQNNGDISDYDNTKPSLWESEANRSKTVRLWRRLSERYKNEAWVAGYDLINEPAWDLPGGTLLRNLYGRITDTIRTNGDNHVLFIEGNWYSNDYTGLTPAWDANMVYVFHKYWTVNTESAIQFALDIRNSQNQPIWCGEHGENSNHWFTELTELLQANNIGSSWWPYKKLESINGFTDARFPPNYNELLNYFGGTNPNLSPATAVSILTALADSVQLQHCTVKQENVRAITSQAGNRNTTPYVITALPGKLYTSDYDQGMNGFAYNDLNWADYRLTAGTNNTWNNSWNGRNNGVDQDPTTDAFTNGFTTGWFNRTEWMKYTVNVATAGTYTVQFRIANGSGVSGTLQVQNEDGTELLGTVSVPSTGGWASWNTVTATVVFRNSGQQKVRLANTDGEYNISALDFSYLNNTIPAPVAVVPLPRYIVLKGNNNLFVTASGPDNVLTCTGTIPAYYETFTVVDASGGLVALKGNNGKYLTVVSTSQRLFCNAASIGTNEKFTLTDYCGMVTLKGYNNLYVSSENGATGGMTCNRSVPGTWEYFNGTLLKTDNSATAVVELNSLQFRFYPNPALDQLVVSSPTAPHRSLIIYDGMGRVKHVQRITHDREVVDTQNWQKGIYFLQLRTGDRMAVTRFIKG